MIGLRARRRAGRPEPSRCARPHRSRPLTGVLCRSRSPLLRCRGWHGFRPSRHFRPPSLLRHPGSHHSALAIHQNAPFGGRTAPLSPPSTKTPHLVDGLPPQALTVRVWACFPEGRCLYRGTFHARGLFPGRSAPFQGDLPCQRLVSRKVPTLFLGTSHVGTVYLVGHGAVGREGGATLMFFAEGTAKNGGF